MRPFTELSASSQVAKLRPIAVEFCREFGVSPRSIRLLHHAFNTSFRVDAEDDRRFAMRINVHSQSGPGQLDAEIAWIRALAAGGRVNVPAPQSSPDGRFILSRPGPLGRPLRAVLYSWLGGRMGVRVATPATLFQLGAATADLHDHAASWNVPEAARFKPLPDLLYGHAFILPEREPFLRTLDLSKRLFDKLARSPRIPIHYDLHLGNVKVDRGKLFVFDFDDAVLAWPILDASVTIGAIRRFPCAEELIAAYWQGLGKKPFGFTDEEFEGLVMCRRLFIANEIAGPIDPASIARRPQFLAAVESELGRFWQHPR